MELTELQEIIERHGTNLKQEIGLALSETYCKQLIKEAVSEVFSLHVVVDRLPTDPIVLARYLHESYEMLAKNNDWNTQENCKVDFSDLPIGNKKTMILLASKLILDFRGN